MPYSLDEIKSFRTIDLSNFKIRGARTGVNNARTTGTLYTQGQFSPSKNVFDGTAVFTSGDATVTGISFNAPFSGLNASILLNGDTLNAGSNSYSVDHYLSSTSVLVQQIPSTSGIFPVTTFRLIEREYLIEPDSAVNTTTGLATFTNGSQYITGSGTNWLTELIAGDSIQLNSYQVYYIVDTVLSNTSIKITQSFGGATTTGFFTTKRWRLNRLDYQYTENDFTYEKKKSKWTYDTTTGSGLVAHDYYTDLKDGIQLKFSPTLKPTSYPDLMDSNLALNKTLTKSTENPLYQYSLPAVPNPEESFQLYINDMPKDRFPSGNMDYVLNYWQSPTYQYPSPMDQRIVANVMPLQKVQNVTLDPVNTAAGIILFTDNNGRPVPGIMPGSEDIQFDGTSQTAYQDYVLDLNTGVGYSSQHNTNEAVVKYIAYEKLGLFDFGITFTLNSVKQQFTLPHKDTDQVLFEFESGRFKPADKDNPAMGEEYIIDYLVEGEFITDETIPTTPGMTWFQTSQYPIKYQGAIVAKNGIIIDENVDYRISYLTGRVVFFTPFVLGDMVSISYSLLIRKKNGFVFEDRTLFCKVYEALTPVTKVYPPEFTLTNPNLSSVTPQILRIHNVTKGFDYDLSNYLLSGLLIHLQPTSGNISIRTDMADVILIDYKFENNSVEHTPVQYINFFIPGGADFIAFIDQDITSLFPADTFIRITDVETSGDYFFRVKSSSFDGYDTTVTLYGTVPSDINNPVIYVSDGSVQTFIPFPLPATNIASGTTNIYFPGSNLSRTFRVGQILQLDTDYYYVQDTQYDQTNNRNVVTIGTQTIQDYTNASVLGNVSYSDCPLYYEGDTNISTTMDIIDDPQTPVMTLNYDGLVSVTSDNTAFYVDFGTDQSSFLYATYPKVSQLSSALTGVGLSVVDYTPDWTSSKIYPMNSVTVTKDSTTLVTILPELRLFATDTTQFTIAGGRLLLNNPLVRGQRYDLDYLGRKPLDDATVEFSASYFSSIPAKSKISASFKFDNLDQFYIQVLSQRDFLENVTQPRMREEAIQQSGNVGQGGEIVGDTDTLNSSGGLTGNEYRRRDAEIECGIFNIIFDFFNDRVQTFADEMYAAFGWRLCNNDGLINPTDETCGTKSINRMFPWADYTSFPPYTIDPLTGQAIPYATMGAFGPPAMPTAKALFTSGSSTVTCTTTGTYPTHWEKQLRVGDYIRPKDTTTDYRIALINNDTQLTLDTTYAGTSVNVPIVMTSQFPLYDDDGHTGGKIVGTVSDDFNLDSMDIFSVTIDGGPSETYNFSSLLLPTSIINGFSGSQIAKLLTTNLTFTRVTYEWVEDINAVYGYKSVFVLRTKSSSNNKIKIDNTPAMVKMGFTPDASSSGNNVDPTVNIGIEPYPEYPYTYREYTDLLSEAASVTSIIAAGAVNLINRVNAACLIDATNIKNRALDEATMIVTETARINSEIAATGKIILEPSMSAYADTSYAYNTDTTYLGHCPASSAYDLSVTTNFEGQVTAEKWILDILSDSSTVNGKDSTGMGVPGSGVTPINGENTFFIHLDQDGTNEKRFLNTTVTGVDYRPTATFLDNSTPVDGTWNGNWEPAGGNQYSSLPANNASFLFNDTMAQFILDYGTSPFAYQVDAGSMTIFWDGIRSKVYPYSTYPTIGALKGVINTLAGVTTSGSSSRDGSSSYTIIQKPLTSLTMGVGVSLDKTSIVMFSMYQDSSLSYNYWVDTTSLNLNKDTTYWNLLFTTYPTISSLRNQVDSMPGLAITSQPAQDTSSSTVLLSHSVAAVGLSPGVPLYDQTYSLFTLINDDIYSHTYAIDKTGITMTWDGSGKLYSYASNTTVGAMKTAINADIPGINATGPAGYDSIPSSFKQPIGTTLIPPDASVYPALRPLRVDYYTTDSKLLLNRKYFTQIPANPTPPYYSRGADTSARVAFLNDRSSQIVQHIVNEEHLRAITGDTGNLYNWADNRFNRSNGCEARLKQIEKQIEMNQASLNVSKRFL